MMSIARKYSNNIALAAILGVVLTIICYSYYTIDLIDGISSQKLTIRLVESRVKSNTVT